MKAMNPSAASASTPATLTTDRPPSGKRGTAQWSQPTSIHPRFISIRGLSSSDEEAWRDLAVRSVEPNPFYEVDFLVPACRYLRGGKSVVLLVAEEEGRFHGCLPVRRINRAGINCALLITSWRHLYCFLGTPLVAPERGVEAMSCLLSALRGTGPWRRIVVLELFGDDGPIAGYLRSAAGRLGITVRAHAPGERAVLCFQEEDRRSLPASVTKQRRDKARQWRRLCRELGTPAIAERSLDGDATVNFLALEAAGWKGKAGTALASRHGDAAFYRELTSRFGASGRLRLYSLEAAGQTLAMSTNFRAGPGLFGWKTAYDERFARYAPGAQLQLRVRELVPDDGLRWFDSCAAVGDDHQLRLTPYRRRTATLVVGGGEWLEGPVLTLVVLVVKVSRNVRELSAKTLRRRLIALPRDIRIAFSRSVRPRDVTDRRVPRD